MPRKPYRFIAILILSVAILLGVAACGGGGGEEEGPAATATPRPPTATPRPEATATPTGGGGGGATPLPTRRSVSREAPTPEAPSDEPEIPATLLKVEMKAYGASGQSGKTIMVQVGAKTKVTVEIAPGTGGPQKVEIRRGRCPAEGEAASGQPDYLLFDVVNGKSVSVVNTPTQFFQFNRDYIIVYVGATSDSGIVSCGNAPSVFG